MKKIFISLLLITFIFTLTGCKKKNDIYNIEDDIGKLIDSETIEKLDNTSYIILENLNTEEEITIENEKDVKNIINILKNSRHKISSDVPWMGSLLHLYLYDNENAFIASAEVFLDIEGSDTLGYVYLTNIFNNKYSVIEGVYYINATSMKEALNKYIN